MSNEQGNEGLVFFASILSKMSQMFSEINSLYLQAMVNKKSNEFAPEFNVNQLFTNLKKEEMNKTVDLEGLDDILQSENESKHEVVKESSKKPIKKEAKKNKKEQDQSIKKPKETAIQPPHPPASSYLFFFNEHRSKIAEEFPNFSIAEQSKVAARCWKQLSDEQKKPYHDRFNEEKQKYYQELKIYNEMKSSEEVQKKKSVVKPKAQKNDKKNQVEGKGGNQKDKLLAGQSSKQDNEQSSELSSSLTI